MKILFKNEIYDAIKTEKGYVIRKPFMIIDKNFTIENENTIYEGEVFRLIVDKKGNEVPILKLKPHICNVCGGKCSCGAFIYHDMEKITEVAEEYEKEILKCKKCSYVSERIYDHDFVLGEGEDLKCLRCGYQRKVRGEEEIRKFAVPPYPIEKILSLYGLSMRDIMGLQERIDEIWRKRPEYPDMDEKLRRSKDLWEGTEFIKYQDLIADLFGIRYKSWADMPEGLGVENNKVWVGYSNDMTLMGEIVGTFYEKEILKEFSTKEELLQTFDIYDEEETNRLYSEYMDKYREYRENLKRWEGEFNEKIVGSDVYKKLIKFMTSSYGREICYVVDPYEGYFGGTAIPPHRIVEVFIEGLEKLGLIKNII